MDPEGREWLPPLNLDLTLRFIALSIHPFISTIHFINIISCASDEALFLPRFMRFNPAFNPYFMQSSQALVAPSFHKDSVKAFSRDLL